MRDRIRFWDDIWCGTRPLKDVFPDLYAISPHRLAIIDSFFTHSASGSRPEWNVTFIQNFNDWEVEGVTSFFEFLQSHTYFKTGGDDLCWKLKGDGKFDIRSFYIALCDFQPVTFPWKAIWGVHVPRRVSFFAWAATWGRILTTDNLKRRGYQLVGRCCMCRCNEETISHLLLHCEVAHGLWNFVFRSFGIVWVLPRSVHDLFSDGVTGWGRIILRFGIWFLLAFSGPYGKNKIIVLLRMRSARGLNFMNYFLILCMIVLQFGDTPTPNLSFLF